MKKWIGAVAIILMSGVPAAFAENVWGVPAYDEQLERAVTNAWKGSYNKRKKFLCELDSKPRVSFLYETQKKKEDSPSVETLSCSFNGWLYEDDNKKFDYIWMMRADWDKLESSCMVSLRETVFGYFISKQTFTVQSGERQGTTFVQESNRLDRRFYEMCGKEYTLVTFPRKKN